MNEVLTRKEPAEFLRLPVKTLDYYVATNAVPYSRLGTKNVRFLRSRLIEHLHEVEGKEYHRPSKAE